MHPYSKSAVMYLSIRASYGTRATKSFFTTNSYMAEFSSIRFKIYCLFDIHVVNIKGTLKKVQSTKLFFMIFNVYAFRLKLHHKQPQSPEN